MATIKYRLLKGSNLHFDFIGNSKIKAGYTAKVWVDGAEEATTRKVEGFKTISIATFNGLSGLQMTNQMGNDIEARIPEVFGPGHTIEEDNS